MKIEKCIRCNNILYYDGEDCEESKFDLMAICYHDDGEYISYFYYGTANITNYMIRNNIYNIRFKDERIYVKDIKDIFGESLFSLPISNLDSLNYEFLINKINTYLNFI